ncbi:MAG: insulinase family protein [Planctomycetes bacterium]|nr:insulinase family protein [Planctomycetota bacterium]
MRNDIAGTEESVRSIDQKALLACYRTFYDPANLCLVVSGDVDPREVVEVARHGFADGAGGDPVPRRRPREPRGVVRRRIEGRLEVNRPKLLIGFKDPDLPEDGEALRRRDLLTAVLLALLFGGSSAPRQRLYEDGVIDDSFYASYAGEEDFGFLTLGAESDEPERVRRALFREIRGFGKTGIDSEDFGRVIHKLTGHFVRGLDSQEGTAFLLLASAFRGIRPFDVPALLRRITPDDVLVRHARLFGPDNHCTSIVR